MGTKIMIQIIDLNVLSNLYRDFQVNLTASTRACLHSMYLLNFLIQILFILLSRFIELPKPHLELLKHCEELKRVQS